MIHWEKVRGLRSSIAVILATAFGAGLTPKAPGTMGSLVGIPIAYATCHWAFWPRVLFWILLTATGTWSARVMDEIMSSSDNQSIVIDEVIGTGIAAWTVGQNAAGLVVAFVLFRFFDVLKPWPVRLVDRWSKIKASDKTSVLASWYGGFGVIADDIVAGVKALIVILLLQHFAGFFR